jgi:hypothetical protein
VLTDTDSSNAGPRRVVTGLLTIAAVLGMLLACGSRSELLRGDAADEGQGAGPPSTEPPPTGGTSAEPNEPDKPTQPNEPNEPPDECVPAEETCNGKDDDCDGAVDDLPSVPCPGGGFRYCVGGKTSECPERCDVCLPGSERVCFTSFCTFWGTQTCAADGRGFGSCREISVPPECEDIALDHQRSRELEQCCLDNGYCCVDDFDLDHDGDTHDLVGQCSEVSCGD